MDLALVKLDLLFIVFCKFFRRIKANREIEKNAIIKLVSFVENRKLKNELFSCPLYCFGSMLNWRVEAWRSSWRAAMPLFKKAFISTSTSFKQCHSTNIIMKKSNKRQLRFPRSIERGGGWWVEIRSKSKS